MSKFDIWNHDSSYRRKLLSEPIEGRTLGIEVSTLMQEDVWIDRPRPAKSDKWRMQIEDP
jgi:hypothetical protein